MLQIAWLGVLLIAGCTSVGVTTLKNPPDQALNSDCRLEFFFSDENLKEGYDSLCEIESRVSHFPWNPGRRTMALINALPLACECGGNVVIIGPWSRSAIQNSLPLRVVK